MNREKEESPLFEARTMLMSAIGMLELASQSTEPNIRTEFNEIVLSTLKTLEKLLNEAKESAAYDPAMYGKKQQVGKEGKILLAEDNEINRRVVSKFLSGRGYKVTAVENGASALEAYDSGSFDLVLLDVMLPEIDGLEVAKRIKNSELKEGRRIVPVIALTALEESQHPEFRTVFDGVIMKPFNSASLLGVIARLGSEQK